VVGCWNTATTNTATPIGGASPCPKQILTLRRRLARVRNPTSRTRIIRCTHATKRWAKKIRGRTLFFGPWDDPDGALKKYLAEKDALHAGRKPREASAGVTVKELCNRFLNAKQTSVDSGELTRSWDDYKGACELVIEKLGKSRLVADLAPDDFEGLRAAMVKKGWGVTTIGNVIQRVRVVFKYAYDSDLIDRPVRYGQTFKRPSRKSVRIDRAKKGPKLFTADEVRKLIDGATVKTGKGRCSFDRRLR
jgi:hypothetical protein